MSIIVNDKDFKQELSTKVNKSSVKRSYTKINPVDVEKKISFDLPILKTAETQKVNQDKEKNIKDKIIYELNNSSNSIQNTERNNNINNNNNIINKNTSNTPNNIEDTQKLLSNFEQLMKEIRGTEKIPIEHISTSSNTHVIFNN